MERQNVRLYLENNGFSKEQIDTIERGFLNTFVEDVKEEIISKESKILKKVNNDYTDARDIFGGMGKCYGLQYAVKIIETVLKERED